LTKSEEDGVIASYLILRRAIGWIGSLLPVVLIAGDWTVSAGPLPDSLSGYYYTPMRNILVGSLCLLGVFLVRSRSSPSASRGSSREAPCNPS
jgi:hypothetical protein